MKKLYLALVAAVLCCSSALADGVNVLFYRSYNNDWTTAYSWTYGGDISPDQWIQAKYLGKETQPFFVLASATKFGNSIFTQSGSWNGVQTGTLTLTSSNEGALAYGYSSSTTSSRSGAVYATSAAEMYGNWDGSSWTGIALTQRSGVVYKTATKTMPSSGSVEFGFRLTESEKQVVWVSPSANLSTTNLTGKLTGGSGNGKITLDEGTEYHLEVDFSTLALTLVIDKEATKTAPDELYLIGDFEGNSWLTGGGIKMTKNGDVFTATTPALVANSSDSSTGHFQMITSVPSSWNDVSAKSRYTAASENQAVVEGTSYTVLNGDSYNYDWTGQIGYTYTVTFDFSTMKLTVTATPPETKIYLYGNIYGGDSWSNTDNKLAGQPMTKVSDGVYTLEDVTFSVGSNGNAYFFFADGVYTSWDATTSTSNTITNYMAGSGQVEVKVDTPVKYSTSHTSHMEFYIPAGDYDVNITLNDGTVTLSSPIDESEGDDTVTLTYVTDLSVVDKPAADAHLTEFGVGSLSITNKKVLTVNLQGETQNDTDAKIGWIKYEDLSNYTSKEWYLSDNTAADYEAYLTANNLEAGYTNWAGKFITGDRTWALDSSDNATTHDCRNFSEAYYRVYVYKTTEHKAKKSGVSTKTVPAKSVSTRVALSINMPENTTGVDEITIDNDNQSVNDADAPVEYYNLQGIRISNPSNGIYIRRQGNSVSKEYVR
jgi:hypothetical protein